MESGLPGLDHANLAERSRRFLHGGNFNTLHDFRFSKRQRVPAKRLTNYTHTNYYNTMIFELIPNDGEKRGTNGETNE